MPTEARTAYQNIHWFDALMFEFDEATGGPPKAIHQLCPAIAKHYGIPASILYEHLRRRSEHSGLTWIVATLSSLEQQFPYLGRKGIRDGLDSLRKGTKTKPYLVRRRLVQGHGCLYQYESLPPLDVSYGNWHTFDAAIAEQLGVVPALLCASLKQLDLTWGTARNSDDREFRQLANLCLKGHVYVSESTIRRSIKALLGAGILREATCGWRPGWSLRTPLARN